jgi:hypothetical protein
MEGRDDLSSIGSFDSPPSTSLLLPPDVALATPSVDNDQSMHDEQTAMRDAELYRQGEYVAFKVCDDLVYAERGVHQANRVGW